VSADCAAPLLSAAAGELVSLSFTVDPKHLEDLLEALALVSFPVNPQLFHRPLSVTVEFPAYASGVPEVRTVLETRGFPASGLTVSATA
jgi:hypothetical protein